MGNNKKSCVNPSVFYDFFNMNIHISDYIFALNIHCRREKERNGQTDIQTDRKPDKNFDRVIFICLAYISSLLFVKSKKL